MLDETVDHQEPPPRQLSLLDLFSTSELASLDGNGCIERMETEPAASLCSVPLSQDVLHLEQICMVEERNFPELIFALGHTGDTKETTLTITQREVYNHPP